MATRALRKPAAAPKGTSSTRPSDALITAGLRRLISERHADDSSGVAREWALFFELRSGTGHGARTSYVDAFALNLWPSKRHWRIAYELKASRSDFLRELGSPGKRAWATDISHEFWYVCYPGVAKPEEIPEGCGLMVCDEAMAKLRKVVHAVQREPRELTGAEVAAFARRSQSERAELFRYAGRDLCEADLEAILKSREDEHFQTRVRERVQTELAARLGSAHQVLERYAQDLRRVGIEPPAWMAEPDLTQYVSWGEAGWAKRTFIEGPGLDALLENERALSQVQAQLARSAEALEHARTRNAALLQRTGAAGAPHDGAAPGEGS